ncbi:MAG TPA: ActS/PrrB/RegB family redox-sensitive histidine kinase [Pseudolabrys sp.]|nr:ActS/PrrB/RegB family redox-sensitive histidine kinase [Pseudolabrys sp.]HEX2538624.1 ActS/PrrB/RegB family redox-sensitive histidine kinase [Pseudolabrys sp.]
MSALDLAHNHPRRNVRLDTLVRLRWLAVIGQTTAVLVVYFGLEFELPLWACLAVIALSAWLNVALRLRFHMTQRLEPDRAAWLLAFDVAELAVLLYLTGGLQNPFAFLFLAPVLLSATALPPRFTVILGVFAIACATVLVFTHYPLPWDPDDPLILPPIFMFGVWLSILLAIGFIGVYAWQITEESRQLSDALAATELVLAREQHLSALDGLAAAAAHELGTPLSTISVIAKELENAIPAEAPHGDDVRLLREQAKRCRDILSKITQLSSSTEPFDRMPLAALMEEIAAPYRNFGVAIDVRMAGDESPEPIVARNPAVLYGLGNLMENAVDFAAERVTVAASWSEETVGISITDDGPGFAPEIIARVGEPYVTSRPALDKDEPSGLGLGFFIAKTLLERSGATLSFSNRKLPEHGAAVFVRWNRSDFERPLGQAAA